MKKIVLLSVGSFNPVTFMHVRMFLLAKEDLYEKLQWHVLGGLISPVHDEYKKKELASAKHRATMIQRALKEYGVSWIQLSQWEIEQKDWQRTLESLEYHQGLFNQGPTEWFADVNFDDEIHVMLLCGSDVLESFSVPGLWSESQVETIMMKFGVACITRTGSNVEAMIRTSPLLSRFKESIVIVPEWFDNTISSTSIRNAVRKNLCISMLVPLSVAEYIKEEHLYLENGQTGKLPLVFLYKALRSPGVVDAYEEALKEAGWNVVQIPVLNFQFLGIPELQSALFRPEQYSGLILTTPRAVEALLLAVKSDDKGWKDQFSKIWNCKPVYAIGEGTAALARTAGLTPIGQEAGNEAALAEIIKGRKGDHEARLLFPCGDLRLETLRNALLENDIFVEYIETYETSAHPELVSIVQDALRNQGFPDVNLFFSPSGVQFMDEILRAEAIAFKQTKYAAIGPTTSDALKKLGYDVSGAAQQPNPDNVVKILQGML